MNDRFASVVRSRTAAMAVLAAAALGAGAGSASAAVVAGPPGDTVGRRYEMVSPADKNGYNVGDNHGSPLLRLGVDPSGDRVGYDSFFPFQGAETGSAAAYSADRGSSGWGTTSLFGPPGPNQIGAGFPGFDMWLRAVTPDQRTAALYWDSTTEPFGSLMVRRADGSRQRLADAAAFLPLTGATQGAAALQAWGSAISNDGRHVVFASSQRLVPGLSPGAADVLYEWVDDGSNDGAGTLRVVNRTNDPTLTLIASTAAELGGSTSAVAGRQAGPRGLRHAISDGSDGHSRIFFQNPAPSSETNATGGPIYMREDGTRTVTVSAPEGANPAATQVRYLDASADGTRVFFWANGVLTDDAVAGGAIYRYDVNGNGGNGDLVYLAAASAISSAPPSAMASDDGSRLYYQRGSDVYVNADGASTLVLANATVGTGLYVQGAGGVNPTGVTFSRTGLRDDAGCVSADLSPGDGRYFVFVGRGTATSNRAQVFRYDASAGTSQQISTSPSAPSTPYDALLTSASCAGAIQFPMTTRGRVMSADGQYVFFDTFGGLVPGDTNGQIDTYQWHDGQVSLISTPGPTNAPFLGTDATGTNVFFASEQPLVAQDGDAVADIYDARIGGGFPVDVPPPPCGGDACQGPPSTPPTPTVAGSISFSGAGDQDEQPEPEPRPTPKVKLGKKAVHGTSVAFRVKVPAKGRIKISGARVATATKSAKKAGTFTVRASLNRRAKRSLKHMRSMKVKVRITYIPSAGPRSSVVTTVTIKRGSRG